MTVVSKLQRLLFLFALAAALFGPVSRGDNWMPINPEELKMTSEPLAPEAPAIILYRSVRRNDILGNETNYMRIKVLAQEGRSTGEIEIPFVKKLLKIEKIEARIIKPSGAVVPYTGDVLEKEVVKTRGFKYLAKFLVLPNVQVGDVIEYRYQESWDNHIAWDSRWEITQQLFTKQAEFSLVPIRTLALRWEWTSPKLLPAGTEEPRYEGNAIWLRVRNLPAVEPEDYMPPQDETTPAVRFYYANANFENDPDVFWAKDSQRMYRAVEAFIGKSSVLRDALREMISSGESSEGKARAIYARVKRIGNLDAESAKTSQELQRKKLKPIRNAEDVWKSGYGNGNAINLLFLALAREAGLKANLVRIPTRDQVFFKPELMESELLNRTVVLLQWENKKVFVDPGSYATPFGVLPWEETAVEGRVLDEKEGYWIKTDIQKSSFSQVQRKVQLQLDPSAGSLNGVVHVAYSGFEARAIRLAMQHEDDIGRRKYLEEELKESMPEYSEAELTSKPEWDENELSLEAEFKVKIRNLVSGSEKRKIITAGIFARSERHLFESGTRKHPIYLPYSLEKKDEITIQLPAGWAPNSLPPDFDRDYGFVGYRMKVIAEGDQVKIARWFKLDWLLLDMENYLALRNVVSLAKSNDEKQIVLESIH